jgi:YYY domain-containing protein
VSSWWPSRAVWDDLRGSDGQVNRIYTITEFPLFSFVLGDLHPHVLALPWALLAITLALNLLTRPSAPEWIRPALGRIELFVTAVTLGGLYAINSWDLPTYILLFGGAMVLLYLRLAPEPGRIVWPHLITQASILLVAAWAVWLPFHMSFVSLVGGDGLPIGLSPVRTAFTQFLIVFGLFAIPLAAFVLHQGAISDRSGRSVLIALAGGAGLLAAGIATQFALVLLLPFAYWAVVLAMREAERPARAFALWATALGALVIFGTEIVYLRDVFEGQTPRMNTLFKFYYQVWLIWGTVAGYALWVLLRRPRPVTALWLVPFVVLLAGSLVYPAVVLPRNAPDRTLDGTDYIARERPADAAAIAWIRANTPGDALVLQAPLTDSYNSTHALIATATGRPTLIGWRGHQDQWRGGQPEVRDSFGERVTDATTIYVTTDVETARGLIDRYGIDYVYVGPAEQEFAASQGAPPEALAKFAEFMGIAWSGEGVTIYRRR